MSARRIGAVVYTANAKDFELLAKYKDFQFEVVNAKNLELISL